MFLSRRLSTNLSNILAATALASASMLPAASAPVRARLPLRGQELVFVSPQFVVTAVRFKANDETGWYWTGSDEVYAVFSDMDPTHSDRVTSTYGDVDEGETRTFRAADTCMAPQSACDRGMSSLNVRFAFWESDYGGFPYGDIAGGHYWLQNGTHSFDDLIGNGSVIMSQQDLVAALPTVGDAREYTVSPTGGSGKYRFTYRITRLPDIRRSIVVHFPEDILEPMITLQATVVTAPQGSLVHLAWSGATTSTVDIFRDGAKVVTTANDGTHNDLASSGAHQYRVCDLGSTTVCSPQASVTVP